MFGVLIGGHDEQGDDQKDDRQRIVLYFLTSYAATKLSMLWPVRYEM
jgi:hypothetical protein